MSVIKGTRTRSLGFNRQIDVQHRNVLFRMSRGTPLVSRHAQDNRPSGPDETSFSEISRVRL